MPTLKLLLFRNRGPSVLLFNYFLMNVGSYLLIPFVAVHGTRDLGLSATAAGVFPIRRGQPPGQRGRTGAGRATAPDRLLGGEPGRGCLLRRVLRLVDHADAARRA